MKDTAGKFSLLTVLFHWLIAVAIIGMLGFGLYIGQLERSPEKGALIDLHKSFGLLILMVASARILWRIKNKFPKALSVMPKWQAILARLSHLILLLATVVLPVSGIIMSVNYGYPVGIFGLEIIKGAEEANKALAMIAGNVHRVAGKILIAFILLHILGALKHQYFDKDGTISRMLGKSVKPL